MEFFEAFKRQNEKLREDRLGEFNNTTPKQELNKQQLSPGPTINRGLALVNTITNPS